MSVIKRYNISEANTLTKPLNLQDITVDAGIEARTFTYRADLLYNGLNTVTVNPVTASIDENIKPENIVEGVTILNTEGSAKSMKALLAKTITNVSATDYDTLTSECFRGQTNLKTFEVKDTLTSIPSYCFYGCTSLANITFPETLTSISDYAFYNCDGLTEVELSNITTIGGYAFQGCSNLTKVTLGKFNTIPSYCFYECSKLSEIVIPDNIEYINGYAFGYTALKTFDISNTNIKRISAYAFTYSSIEELKLPTKTELTLEYGFARNMQYLTKCTIPSNFKGYYNSTQYLFRDCYRIEEVDLPEKLNSFGSYNFYNCYRLKKVILRSPTMCTPSTSNFFYNAYIMKGTTNSAYNPNGEKGTIYVPEAIIEEYRANSTWSQFNFDTIENLEGGNE